MSARKCHPPNTAPTALRPKPLTRPRTRTHSPSLHDRWNERPYNTTYLKQLRVTLDDAGFSNVQIAAPDSGWDIAKDMLADPVLMDAIGAIGAHYPGTHSSSEAEQTGKPLWASEDDSTYANTVGAQCWARVINNNYVEGNMTASINCKYFIQFRQPRPRTQPPTH